MSQYSRMKQLIKPHSNDQTKRRQKSGRNPKNKRLTEAFKKQLTPGIKIREIMAWAMMKKIWRKTDNSMVSEHTVYAPSCMKQSAVSSRANRIIDDTDKYPKAKQKHTWIKKMELFRIKNTRMRT